MAMDKGKNYKVIDRTSVKKSFFDLIDNIERTLIAAEKKGIDISLAELAVEKLRILINWLN